MGQPVLFFCTLPESHNESRRYQNRSLGWRPAGRRRFLGATCAVFLHAPRKSQRVTTVPKPQPGLAPCARKKVPWGNLCCVLARSKRVTPSHNISKTTAWAGALREEEGPLGQPVLFFFACSQRVTTSHNGPKTATRAGTGATCLVFFCTLPESHNESQRYQNRSLGWRPAGGRGFPGATCAVFWHAPSRSQRVITNTKPQPRLAPCGRKMVPWCHLVCVFLHAPSGSRRIITDPKLQPGLAPCGRKRIPWGHLCCVFAHSRPATTNQNGSKITAWAGALREEECSLGAPVLCFRTRPAGHSES